jgi:hypothetical protein
MATPHCAKTVCLVIGREWILHAPILATELALSSELDNSKPSQNAQEGKVLEKLGQTNEYWIHETQETQEPQTNL